MFWESYFKTQRWFSSKFYKHGFFAELERADHKRYQPIDVRLEQQFNKLQILLQKIYKDNDYYKSLCESKHTSPENIRSLLDLQNLPIIEKEGIRSHFPGESVTRGEGNLYGIKDRTAGSTGNPLFFLRDKRALQADWIAYALSRLDTGWKFGEREVLVKAIVPELTIVSRFKMGVNLKPFRFAALDFRPEALPHIIKQLLKISPVLYAGYPSAALIIARFCLQNNIQLNIPKMLTSGEVLTEDQRQFLQETLGSQVYRLYAASECMYIAWECRFRNGYHIDLERFIVEAIDDKGMPIEDGEEGEILVTNLDNFCMPFIRYRLADYGTISNEACPCGITGPMIKELHGKIYYVIITPTGKQVSIHFFGALFRDMGDSVDQFQIIQTAENQITYLIVPRGLKLSDEVKSNILKRTIDYVAGSMDVKLIEVKKIEPDQSGKRPMVKKDFTFMAA